MIRKIALTIVTLLVVTPTAADAALHLYADKNYQTWLGSFSNKMSSPRNMSPNANDRLSSFKNETGYHVAFYHDSNGKGRCFTGNPNSNAAWFAPWDDNKVSSFQLGRSCK